jgi:hypothetical protein
VSATIAGPVVAELLRGRLYHAALRLQLLPAREEVLAPRQQRQAHPGDHPEGDPRAHVRGAKEAVANRLHDVEERVDVEKPLPWGAQAATSRRFTSPHTSVLVVVGSHWPGAESRTPFRPISTSGTSSRS